MYSTEDELFFRLKKPTIHTMRLLVKQKAKENRITGKTIAPLWWHNEVLKSFLESYGWTCLEFWDGLKSIENDKND